MSNFASLIDQSIHIVPSFTLECGSTLTQVPVAYKTWGKLNETRDNVMIICHAFTGSADVEDWWGPLMGRGKAFDPNRFFIICCNVLGSPYGSASPVTINPETGNPYGPEFPPTTIRDDVRIHKLVLDHLGVTSVAVVIGGSMGGMAVLEWPLCSPPGYIKHVIPLATSARHSAWCISWGEAQRQSIYSDPSYQDGYYTAQPASGLAAARMSALLTYRSRDSFESRFGRKPQVTKMMGVGGSGGGAITPPASPRLVPRRDDVLAAHNDGLKNSRARPVPLDKSNSGSSSGSLTTTTVTTTTTTVESNFNSGEESSSSGGEPSSTLTSVSTTTTTTSTSPIHKPPIFSAQSYLRYQGDKFTARFDANCYIHITRKLDTHDVARDRVPTTTTNTNSTATDDDPSTALPLILSRLPARALVISIATDGLFTTSEQRELAAHIPGAELVVIDSPDGHDGFLLEFEEINRVVLGFLRREFGEYYLGGGGGKEGEEGGEGEGEGDFRIVKTSVFGEAEVDVTRW